MQSHWTWKITDAKFTSERADNAVAHALQEGIGHWEIPLPLSACPPPSSRSQVQKWIEAGFVKRNGNSLHQTSKLHVGDHIEIFLPPPTPLELTPEKIPLTILFEDEHLLVVNKPQGLSVHPSETEKKGTLVHALLHHVRDLKGIGDHLRPGIVHRLDKGTSGALVITKTHLSQSKLSLAFSRHEIERRYLALCFSAPEKFSFKIETLIGRNPADRKKMSVKVKTGRRAITHIQVLERYKTPDHFKARTAHVPFASLLEATLETGRTHQVRVHLTHAGHSVLGDPTYGRPTEKQFKWLQLPEEVQHAVERLPAQALHAKVLGFIHPVTGQRLRFEADPPALVNELLLTLRKYKFEEGKPCG